MQGLEPRHKVMQWHMAEVKRVPEQARVLASSALIPVQALAVGDHAMSTQFHCEFSPQTVAGMVVVAELCRQSREAPRRGRLSAPRRRKPSR